MINKEPLWTLDQLLAQVEAALATAYEGAPSGRVRDVPDRRTLRYYTTLGLIDRPAELRGRTGYYGRRHLLQLVAIKRMQARGLSLAQIQHHLLGLTSQELEALAQVPACSPCEPEKAASGETPTATERPFWKEAAAPVAPAALPPRGWQGVPLTDQVLVLLDASRPLREEDLQAIHAAAAPLLDLLQTRQLLT